MLGTPCLLASRAATALPVPLPALAHTHDTNVANTAGKPRVTCSYKYQRDKCGPMYTTIGDGGNVEGLVSCVAGWCRGRARLEWAI